jgi:glycosyltransferase involved in cell wall biosynthesis
MPKISVITPCYNSENYIDATIESVRRQTFSDWEQIIVNDGSSDNSIRVIESKIEVEPRLRLLNQKNAGVSSARNFGYRASSIDSQYIIFLDSDDYMEVDMLEILSRHLDANPRVGLVHCDVSRIGSDGAIIPEEDPNDNWLSRYVPTSLGIRSLKSDELETPFCSIFTLASILPSTSLIRRSYLDKAGEFDEQMGQICEDTDLFLRIALHSEVHCIAKKLLRYRAHSSQSTALAEKIISQHKKFYKKWQKIQVSSPYHRRLIAHARWFRVNRLMPMTGLRLSLQHLKSGNFPMALRFLIGALRRYRPLYLGLPPHKKGK